MLFLIKLKGSKVNQKGKGYFVLLEEASQVIFYFLICYWLKEVKGINMIHCRANVTFE